jgi:basic membrane protein A
MQLYGVFAGRIDDGGFIESGYLGALAAQRRSAIRFDYVQEVAIEAGPLTAAVEAAAGAKPDLLLVHGGRSDEAVEAVAPAFPATRFLSTHGRRAGLNYSCFGIRQFQSAFLAGALAGLLTRSGVVGHLSGIRIAPGLRSRAAYAHGVRHSNPSARLVTCFCGTQDDNQVSFRAASAEFDQGVDILYTMLNYGRSGSIDACRERRVPQIGNVRDWTTVHPDVFVASALADSGRLVEIWVDGILSGKLLSGEVREVGIEDPQAVSLSMAARVPANVRERIEALTADVRAGNIAIEAEYAGPEFAFA